MNVIIVTCKIWRKIGLGHETSLAETETRPKRWQFSSRRDRDETLIRLETVSRPRRRDRDHNPAPYHSPNLQPGPCSSAGIRRETDKQTHRNTYTQTLPWPIYISPRLCLTRNELNVMGMGTSHTRRPASANRTARRKFQAGLRGDVGL